MIGLAKIASHYEELQRQYQEADKAWDNEQNKLDPKLRDKEDKATGIGIAGGLTAGLLGGATLGAMHGISSYEHPIAKGLAGIGHGVAGAAIGMPIGLIGGFALSQPFANHYRKQQDPEIMKRLSEIANHQGKIDDEMANYETDHPDEVAAWHDKQAADNYVRYDDDPEAKRLMEAAKEARQNYEMANNHYLEQKKRTVNKSLATGLIVGGVPGVALGALAGNGSFEKVKMGGIIGGITGLAGAFMAEDAAKKRFEKGPEKEQRDETYRKSKETEDASWKHWTHNYQYFG